MNTIYLLDKIFFVIAGLCTAYLFIYALFSMRRRSYTFPPARKQHRFAVLIPAYKEDRVIGQSVASVLAQQYPAELYRIVVIADRLCDDTIEELSQRPIRLLQPRFEQSSKARALNFAMESLAGEEFDVVVILDADNTVGPDFLDRLNDAYHSGARAMQAHRKAKNLDTDTAILDAVSEEINNSIFRRGHIALGISSALIGSGMAFDYRWFRENVSQLETAGEDKELEKLLLKQRVFIEYLDHVEVLDEKTQKDKAFYNQRRRWLAAQFYSLAGAIRDLPGAVLSGNLDYYDKLFQWMMPPRIVLAGMIPLWGAVMLPVDPVASLKWWGLLLALLFAMAFAIPDYLVDKRFKRALRKAPLLFVMMVANMFRIRGAKTKFIHTSHGETA